MMYFLRLNKKRYQALLLSLLAAVSLWAAWPQAARGSLHTYHEQPGQVTYRSRQSLRDYNDRAWQAIVFKRIQGDSLQGIYLRLVGFPGAIVVDRQNPVRLFAATGQQWQLPWARDPQTKALPDSVGQYNLQPFLQDLTSALPLEMQIPLEDPNPVEIGVAPFIVEEWLAVKAAADSSPPIGPPLRE